MDKPHPLTFVGLPFTTQARIGYSFSKNLPLEDMVWRIAKFYKIPYTRLLSKTRKEEYRWPRQVAHYMAVRFYRTKSLSEIGRAIGNKHHATVLHSCSAVEDFIETNKRIAEEIKTIDNLIRERKTPE